MNLVADIEWACAQAKIGSEHAEPITSLLMKVIAEGLDGVEDQRNPSIDHVNSLNNCLTCVDSPTDLQSIACEDWANNVDPELFGTRKSRVRSTSPIFCSAISRLSFVMLENKPLLLRICLLPSR